MNIDIGSKIKTLRLSKSMTQEQLAKALHVSAQAVSKWENGSSLPDIQLLPALSVTLGTSIDSLFSLTDESRFARIDNMLWDKRFLTQQEFDEEEHFFQEKCREEETRPRATLLLAELYCKRAREYNDLASPLARQALALNPDCKEAHNAIFDAEHGAYLDWNATNHYRTIVFYQEFLAAHPENHSAHLWLLDLLIADRRCAEAREVLDKMHRLKPTYNDNFYLGCILLQEGHTDDALAQWEAMCAKYPDTWEVYVMRASELSKLAHYDEAIADYEKAMALMPPPRFVDPAEAIAQICEIRGDYETAITYYEKVIAIEKADWHETQGEAIDAPQRSIARLREKLASR